MTIKEARKKAELTQTQLAEKIGVKQQNLCRWENGGRTPKLDALKKISKVCKVPLEWLLANKTEIAANKAGLYNCPITCNAIFERIPKSISKSCTSDQLSKIALALEKAYQDGRNSTRAEIDISGNDIVWLNLEKDSSGHEYPLYGIEWHEENGNFTAKCLTK